MIEPANSQVVYVPQYDPRVVYGAPVVAWPGWVWYPGLYVPGPGMAFGVGIGVGLFAGFGWGWHHWGADWHHRTVIYNHNTYISHTRTFIHRNYYFNRARGHFAHGGEFHGMRDFHGLPQHGFVAHRQIGTHPGTFSGYDHGGIARDHAFHGWSRFGGGFHGGGFHGGGFHGAGFHGGGFHGGGRR